LRIGNATDMHSRAMMSSVQSDAPPKHVLLFSGHMIDGSDRQTPRFPAAKEPLAALAIANTVAEIGAGPGDLAICGGACGGDLLFAIAGLFWAIFGVLLRHWQVSGTRAVAMVGALSVLVYTPLYIALVGYESLLRMSFAENLLQVIVQGLIAGVLPIFLFARAVVLLGAGRAAVFPALVPGFSLIIGYLALGIVPSLAQVAGLLIVVIGFRFALR